MMVKYNHTVSNTNHTLDVSRCQCGSEGGRDIRVDDVIFPAQCGKCDGVDVLVEYKGAVDRHGRNEQSLGSEVVRQDLEGVGAK
jgi:hypothetical protein